VVDDGSRDRTAEVAAGIQGVTLVRHPKNRGYGAALKTGFSQARGDLIGFLDADGTYPPEYFPKLCQSAMNGSDLVIGSRMAGEDSQMPLTRRVGNLFFATLLTLLGRQKVTDSASGMRVFKREILEHIYPLPDGLNLTPVMSTRALHEGITILEVPIPYSERVGRSKLSVIHDGRVFLQSMVWTALSYNPVRFLGLIGMVGMGISGLIFISLLIAQAERGHFPDALGGGCALYSDDYRDGRREHLLAGCHIQLSGFVILQEAHPPGFVRETDLQDPARPAIWMDGHRLHGCGY
jgi:glycosyltransferase involved in cell wall biosynthesis